MTKIYKSVRKVSRGWVAVLRVYESCMEGDLYLWSMTSQIVRVTADDALSDALAMAADLAAVPTGWLHV